MIQPSINASTSLRSARAMTLVIATLTLVGIASISIQSWVASTIPAELQSTFRLWMYCVLAISFIIFAISTAASWPTLTLPEGVYHIGQAVVFAVGFIVAPLAFMAILLGFASAMKPSISAYAHAVAMRTAAAQSVCKRNGFRIARLRVESALRQPLFSIVDSDDNTYPEAQCIDAHGEIHSILFDPSAVRIGGK